MYGYKVYYVDGSYEVFSGVVSEPNSLYNILDGFIKLDELYNLDEKELSNSEILELGVKAYEGKLKEFNRLEIINVYTNEVIDEIDC